EPTTPSRKRPSPVFQFASNPPGIDTHGKNCVSVTNALVVPGGAAVGAGLGGAGAAVWPRGAVGGGLAGAGTATEGSGLGGAAGAVGSGGGWGAGRAGAGTARVAGFGGANRRAGADSCASPDFVVQQNSVTTATTTIGPLMNVTSAAANGVSIPRDGDAAD